MVLVQATTPAPIQETSAIVGAANPEAGAVRAPKASKSKDIGLRA